MAPPFSIAYTQIELNTPNDTFQIPNLNVNGLLVDRVVFDPSCLSIFKAIKEFKLKLGGRDAIKVDGAYFAHKMYIDFASYEHEMLNSTDDFTIGLSFNKDKLPTTGPNIKTTQVGMWVSLTFSVIYRETVGEIKTSCSVTNSEELNLFLSEKIKNPLRVSFKPKTALPNGFTLKPKLTVTDECKSGIFNIDEIQVVREGGVFVDWDFNFVPVQILREHFCMFVDISAPKGVNIYPMDIVVYSTV